MKKIISVIGDALIDESGEKYKLAYEIGKTLVDNGYRVQSGGMKGVMEAAFRGARASKNYKEGDTVAICPSFDRTCVNPYADIVIPTGLDIFRNFIVANADAVVAIGGGGGTLSEIASAWTMKRLIIGMTTGGGWAAELAGRRIDERIRYEDIPDDKIYPAKDADEVISILKSKLDSYNTYHKGIPYVKNKI
jgi:uncharacterized protein (TIGR00725 family)